ncbi:MAG: hypothetical protein IKE64_11235 [Thermoguttaceae bacterium]|nr:hypothetical protein [Thermoguttaceae bacterium]
MAGNKKKTAPKAKQETAPVPIVAADAVPKTDALKVVKEGLVWLVIWSCLFLCFDGCRKVIRHGLPSIKFEWSEPVAKSSLGRWIVAERPALLKGDYPAVGRALGETARRLRAGELDNMNAAAADTIARAQPEVSDPAPWRTFLSRLGGQLEGGSLEKLAEQYEEAAGYFGIKEVQALIDAAGEVEENEEVADEIDPPAGDSGGFVGDERPDESEDIPIGGGEDCGPLPGAEKEGGTADGTPSGCPGGNCPRTAAKTYQSNPWYGYGWPWMSW